MKNAIKFSHDKAIKKQKRTKPLFFLTLLLVEIVLGVLFFINIVPFALFGLIHCIIIALMLLILYRKREQDLTQLVLGFIVTMIAGPIGAISFLLFRFALRFAKPTDNTLIDNWYARLSSSVEQDHETQKFEHIFNGRAAGLGNLSVHHFESVMESNNLFDKQTLLGIIALKYRPEYLPILKGALADKDPTIRVQSAAAYTKLRTHFKNILKEHSKADTINMDNPNAQSYFTKKILALSTCIDSGLLDQGETKDIKAYLNMLQTKASENQFPRSMETDLVFSALLQEKGKYEEARQLLKKYLSSGNKEIQQHYTQCLLALKQFDKISTLKTINA